MYWYRTYVDNFDFIKFLSGRFFYFFIKLRFPNHNWSHDHKLVPLMSIDFQFSRPRFCKHWKYYVTNNFFTQNYICSYHWLKVQCILYHEQSITRIQLNALVKNLKGNFFYGLDTLTVFLNHKNTKKFEKLLSKTMF